MNVLIGQANSGKTTRLLLRIADVVGTTHGNAILLVPSSSAADVFRQRLAPYLVPEISAQTKFLPITFPNFAQRIIQTLGKPYELVSLLERQRLLKRIVAGLAEEKQLNYFAKNADKPGLLRSLARFIDELWNSGTDAASFARLTHGGSKKDEDLARIFSRYESALNQQRVLDDESAPYFALQALAECRSASLPEAEKSLQQLQKNFPLVVADGFDFFTAVQVKLLATLSAIGIETAAAFTYEADRAVHLWQQRTYQRFIEVGADFIPCAAQNTPGLARLAARLMEDAKPESDDESNMEKAGKGADRAIAGKGAEAVGHIVDRSPSNMRDTSQAAPVQIISAADRAAEVRAVAREIKRLVFEEKVALDEITVICRSLNLYAYHIERVFEECAIQLELDNQLPLGENPFIVALLRLLQIHAEQFQRRAVINALRSPYFDFSVFGLDDSLIDLLEKNSLDERVILSREQWRDALENSSKHQTDDADEPASPEMDEPTKSTLLLKLNRFFDEISFPQASHRAHYVRQIMALLNTLNVEARIAQSERAYFDEAAWQAFSTRLQTLRQVNEAETIDESSPGYASTKRSAAETLPQEITWAAFYQELESAVSATSFRRPKPLGSTILVQEAHNLRPRWYRAIFVIGLIEGEFPRKSTETTPYTLAEKTRLRQLGIDFSETINDAGADLTQFHKALTRASERLYLSYARTDFSGGELLKSYLIDEVLAVANPTEIRVLNLDKQNEKTAIHQAASLEELALVAAASLRLQDEQTDNAPAALSANPLTDLLAGNLPSWPATRRGIAVERRRLAGLERGVFGGVLNDQNTIEKIAAIFNEDYTWSATRLNDYGICPFRFFAKNLLELEPMNEPSVGLAAEGLGIAYHKILEKTFQELKTSGLTLNDDTIEQAISIADEHCEATLQKMLDDRLIRQNALWDFDKSEIKKRIKNLLRAEAVWQSEQSVEPIRFEQSFGQSGQPPLILDSPEGTIKIRGSIDRIDKQGDGLAVIDYKTSRSPINARDAIEGRNLQLPIYLLAAQRVLNLEEAVTSGYYLHIYSCKKGSEFPNKTIEMNAITEKAEAFIREYVSRARRAEFPIQPNQHRCPPYCEFDSMCRIQSLGAQVEEEETSS